MSNSRPVGTYVYAWVIIICGVAAFALVAWLRTRSPVATELEKLVAVNEPEEHVHALAVDSGGTTYVGTHLGLAAARGNTGWRRLPGLETDVTAVVPLGGDKLLVAGDSIGLVRYEAGRKVSLLAEPVAAMAQALSRPERLLAAISGGGIMESLDAGRSWRSFPVPPGATVTALAIDPADGHRVLVGGLNGYLALTADNGVTWTSPSPIQGTVSSLAFEPVPPHRVVAAAGGGLWASSGPGAPWKRLPDRAGGRTVVAAAFSPGGSAGTLQAVTAEGYLYTDRLE